MDTVQVSKQNIRVAILMEDILKAKEISNVFRLVGIVPEYYEDLREFWKSTLVAAPSFCIVDVKMMNQEELLFKDHPLVVKGKMPTAFYFNEDSKALLFSTFDKPALFE